MTAEKDYQKECGKLKRQLGVAKKKIETLEKQLAEEKTKGDAYEQLQDINLAMITAIVRTLGEVRVSQSLINETLEQKVQTNVQYDTDTGEYLLRIQESE